MKRQQDGFTLIEVLVVMVLLGIVLGLSATSLRHYWQLQTLNSSRDSLISEMRSIQERSVSESHPLVYGVRFAPASASSSTSGSYAVVKYDPGDLSTTSDDTCTVDSRITLGGGVFVSSATFTAAGTPVVVGNCPTSGTGTNKFAFYYARGTATSGTVTIKSSSLGETRVVTVSALTGRTDAQ